MPALKTTDRPPHLSSSWIGKCLAFWLGGVFSIRLMSSLKSHDNSEGILYLVLLVIAIIWPLLYFIGSKHKFKPTKIRTGSLIAICIFFLFSILSSFASPTPFTSLAFIGLTIASTLISLQFLSNIDSRQLEGGMKLYALLMGIILLLFTLYDYAPGERLGEGKKILNPNSIAMVAFSASLAAMAFRNIILRYVIFSELFIIIYLTGSRGSAAGAMLGLAAITLMRMQGSKISTKAAFLLIMALVLTSGLYFWDVIGPIIDDFLDLNTRDRGITSGASGRIYAWMETIKLFEDNPLFGVGFRAHEKLLSVGSSSHNGYLAMLAEIGLIGFLAVIYLVLSGVFMLWRKSKLPEYKHAHSILFGISIGYVFLAFFERFLINVGNPTSLLFLLGILSPVLYQEKTQKKQKRLFLDATRANTQAQIRVTKTV
ncbi:MAG: O-antigen ligase family protein [Candidatus Methylumidiphilus sp.]